MPAPRGVSTTPTIDRHAASGPGVGLDGARVLVVENDADARRAMERLFGQWGCDPRACADATSALAAIESGRWRPDLVVADQHLGAGERGTVVVARVRRRLRSGVPALIVTANPSSALRERTEREAMELMRKPLKPARLRALLTHMRSVGAPGADAARIAGVAEVDPA